MELRTKTKTIKPQLLQLLRVVMTADTGSQNLDTVYVDFTFLILWIVRFKTL